MSAATTRPETQVTEVIDTSYTVLSLLTVCEYVCRNHENSVPNDINSVANCLTLAGELAGEIHECLERLEQAQKRGAA